MKRTIDQFMWGFQPHFRWHVEYEIRQALSQIGLDTQVRVLLIGYASNGDQRYPVCIEPEDGPLEIKHLASVTQRAEELFNERLDTEPIPYDPRLRRQQHLAFQKQSRALALVEAIEQSGTFPDLHFFASRSAPINGYEVHTCIGVRAADLDGLSSLPDSTVERVHVGRSLPDEVIGQCLGRADRALYLPDAGTGMFVLGPTEDIIMSAAKRLTDGSVFRATGVSSNLFDAANRFSSLSYERSTARGRLAIVDIRKAHVQIDVRFERPIPLGDSRTIRKLLEVTDDTTRVLANGSDAYGLGNCAPGPKVTEISVLDNAEWELSVNGSALLRVSNGRAALPRASFDFERFADITERTVGTLERDRVEDIINIAHKDGHGMTLVITSDPAQETDRLGGEAMTVEPTCLTPEQISHLGRMDGAILLGPDGRCHAFGVILDGTAVGRGDRARGSRFNSAVRYQRTQREAGNPAVLVVISVDGSIDMLPSLRPRVHRHEVETAVHTLCSIGEAEEVDAEEFSRANRRVEEFAFYLSEEQCQRVNDCLDNVMRRRVEQGGIAAYGPPMRPAAEMDDSHFY